MATQTKPITTKNKIFAGVFITLALAGAGLFISRKKQDIQNILFGISFNRIHGFIGEGFGKFVNPKIRIYLNIDINNQSNNTALTANNIFVRIQALKAGSKDWEEVAISSKNFTIVTKPGTNVSTPIPIDFSGIQAISSVINKTTKHRVLYSYTFLGQPIKQAKSIALNTMIRAYIQPFLKLLGLNSMGEIEATHYTPYTTV